MQIHTMTVNLTLKDIISLLSAGDTRVMLKLKKETDQ